MLSYTQSVQKGLAHVGGHLVQNAKFVDQCLNNIDNGTGSQEGSLLSLRSHAEAACVMAWFADHDLMSCKQWAYVAGKIDRILYQANPTRGIWGALGERKAMLWPLLSDHPKLAAWFAEFDAVDIKRVAKSGSFEFQTYQAKLALRGEWDALGERSERFLADVPKRMERFAPDNRFHLALARGDVSAMESALAEMVTSSAIRWRNGQEGYTGWFIVVEAVIYAKTAWRHGFEVSVDTPWIPADWLPVSPLPRYDDSYVFMQLFDIDTPILM
jgi:Immunity protein 49